MAFFELKHVSKSYGDGAQRSEVLEGIDLEVDEGEFIAIVGFSGSGKSTLLAIMASLIAPDSGEVLIEGKPVFEPGPERGIVFQNYSLLPWRTVAGNIALAVDQVFKSWSQAERRDHVQKYIEMVNLTPARDKYPSELSGGMRQRVALARGLSIAPKILLLDEPLSALDALTRATLQSEIELIWERERKTVVLITNDVDEAVLLADRIIPLKPGPRASFGPAFPVRLERPRDRTAMNHDPEFKKVRNEVTNYLLEVGRASRPEGLGDLPELPDLRPADLRPPTYRRANR